MINVLVEMLCHCDVKCVSINYGDNGMVVHD